VITLVLPFFWPIAPLLFLPGIPKWGEWVYQRVARARYGLACDSQCSADPLRPNTEDGRVAVFSSRGSKRPTLRYALALSGMTAVLLFCWYNRIEYYPFTGMQMYSRQPDKSGIVTYYKVLAHYESGLSERTYPEKVIGAMADSRYRKVLRTAFSPSQAHVSEKFFASLAALQNKKTENGQKVIRYEVQKWRWNFLAQPLDLKRGEVVERLEFRVPEANKSDPSWVRPA
jgi:hypothetical protein